MQAFEAFNKPSDWKIAPTPSALASHTGADDGFAQLWLSRGGHQARLLEYLSELGYPDVATASHQNRIKLSMNGGRSLRELIKWSESAYGAYEW